MPKLTQESDFANLLWLTLSAILYLYEDRGCAQNNVNRSMNINSFVYIAVWDARLRPCAYFDIAFLYKQRQISQPLLLYLPECFCFYFSFLSSSFCILFFPFSVLLFSSFCFHLNPLETHQTLKFWEPDQSFCDVFRGLTSQLPTVVTLYPVSLRLFFCCCISLKLRWLEQGRSKKNWNQWIPPIVSTVQYVQRCSTNSNELSRLWSPARFSSESITIAPYPVLSLTALQGTPISFWC